MNGGLVNKQVYMFVCCARVCVFACVCVRGARTNVRACVCSVHACMHAWVWRSCVCHLSLHMVFIEKKKNLYSCGYITQFHKNTTMNMVL